MPIFYLDKLPALEIAPGIVGRIVTADSMTVAHVSIVAGSILPEHAHVHEQVVNVIQGKLELTVEGKVHILIPGTAMVLPPNVPHSGKAITDVKVIDVFHPVREDFIGTNFAGYDKK
ncbi:MAG: cupin domain-containing protein [candidate division Zixibacteria bacterium]|nr:cupin domain-containing protein [candidate division Zixibacteria bacterium]